MTATAVVGGATSPSTTERTASSGHPSAAEIEPTDRPQPAKQPAKQPAEEKRGSGNGLAIAALGLAVIALGGVVSAPLWTPSLYRTLGLPLAGPTGAASTVDSADIAALRESLSDLESSVGVLAADSGRANAEALLDRVDATEARLAVIEQIATPVLLDRLSAIDGAVEALASDLARLDGVVGNQRVALSEARTALTGLESSVEELAAALDNLIELQARDSLRIDRLVASDSAAQAFVLAIGQLRAAIEAGRPFGQPLAALQGLAAGDPDVADDLAALAGMAGTGIPTRERLKAEFPAMAAAAREADRLSGTEGWVDEALAQVQGLVSVRPAPGEVSGSDAPALLARAEGRLDAGDLNGALAEVERLDGAAATAAESWRTAARTRLNAESTVARLYDLAIGRLAESSPVSSQ